MPESRLIVAIGNPSRGDDALGPTLIERLEQLPIPDTELLTDFQLQVEYVLDLQGRDEVIFVDAAASGAEPYAFSELDPAPDHSISSHAVSPQALLDAYRRMIGPVPKSYVLAIRGYGFELGAPISEQAGHNLDAALGFLRRRIERT